MSISRPTTPHPSGRSRTLTALMALAVLPLTTRTAIAQTLDHFTCYKARATSGTAKFVPRSASIQDAFRLSTVTVVKPRFLCAPTSKNGEDPTAPTHPDHLEDYKIKPSLKLGVLGQVVQDQFGSLTLDVVKPLTLQVPTAKSLSAPPPAPVDPAPDHFQCYRVRTASGAPRFVPRPGVAIEDQFGARTVTVKKPKRLCVPANKNGEAPGAETHPDHLLCYQIKETSEPRFAVDHEGDGPERIHLEVLALQDARGKRQGPQLVRETELLERPERAQRARVFTMVEGDHATDTRSAACTAAARGCRAPCCRRRRSRRTAS